MSNLMTQEEKDERYRLTVPIADEFRKSFISENEPIVDTFKMIEQLGFLLVRFPAVNGSTDLSGFYIDKEPFKCIYVNSNQNLGRQYYSVWHECYHAYTGRGNGLSYVSQNQADPIEYEAETFAGCILMPDVLVKTIVKRNNINVGYIKYTDIIVLQNFFRVGYRAMLTRLMQVYPEHMSVLKQRYVISNNTPEQIERLHKYTEAVNGDLKLIQPTNDIYVPQDLFHNIQFNLKEQRISKDKAYEILQLIDGIKHGN